VPESSYNIVHVRQWPTPGERFGMSPIQRHATLFGLALAVERFGQQWFMEGAHPSAVLETDQVLDAEKASSIQDRVLSKMQGTRAPVALGAGLKYRPIQLAPEESQFLQTQQFTAAQVCRILGPGLAEILGYATGDSMTYKNREQLAIDLLTYTVDPILVQLERKLSAQIGGKRTRYIKFNRGALLRTDLKTRFEAHRIALGPVEPFETVNEVRAFEDMQPIQWGDDKPAVQGVTDTEPTPLDLAEIAQKAYLSVGKMLSPEEVRQLLIAAGMDIPPTPPPGATTPTQEVTP
jgi:HK97 family phage portal protein